MLKTQRQRLLPLFMSQTLQEAYNKAKIAGGAIAKEIFDFPGGTRFHFQDPAGNNLAAWSE